jgi:hexosaminidase
MDAANPVSIGRWTARWLHGGLYLDYDHVPLTRGGLVQLFAPDYARGYYGSGSQPPDAAIAPLPDGGRSYIARFRYTEAGRSLNATQTIDVHPQDRVIYTIHAVWQSPDAALLEWNPLRLWAYPLVGAAYLAQPAQGAPVLGRISYRPLPGRYPATNLAPPWTTLLLRNCAVGDITLTGQVSADGPILFDGREDPDLQYEKLFWGGYPALELKPGQDITYSLTLTVAPRSALPALPIAKQTVSLILLRTSLRSLTNTQTDLSPLVGRDGHPVVIPQPKQAMFAGGDYLLRGILPVTTTGLSGAGGLRVREDLARLTAQLQREARVRVEGGNVRAGHSARATRGLLVAIASGPLPAGASPSGLPSAPDHAEGYALQVTPRRIAIIGHDAAGAYYGLQTLRQLLRPEAGGTLGFAGVTIMDWPSLAFRGAHIFVGRDALPLHKKLIERIFSRYKMNKLVVECEYTAWKSHPEIRVDYSMSPHDLRADVAFARDHFLEPIPLINSLGHNGWIFANGQHLDIVEDPQVPYSYNASNPASYRFLFDIYAETLDIFHPRWFHIGHDEVRYPTRPENIKRGLTALFNDDTNHLADWLRARGERTMLWGDMLLHASEGTPLPGLPTLAAANAPTLAEAQERRARLPKDAVVADWRYTAGSEQRNGLATLQQAGFTTLGCAWYEPENIRGWAQQVLQNHAWGTLQTIWAGYDSNESLLESEYNQFTAYVLAAEYAWSCSTQHPDIAESQQEPVQNPKSKIQNSNLLPYTAAEVFARSYRDLPGEGKARPGWLWQPQAAANVRLALDAGDDIPLRVPVPQQAAVSEPHLAHDAATGILTPDVPTAGIMLRGALALPVNGGVTASPLPRSVVLRVNRRARLLAFLHATAYGVATGTRVGTYAVLYADGKKAEIPLRYGYQIRALDDHVPSSSFSTSTVELRAHTPLTLRLFQWRNPRPGVAITSVEFQAKDLLSAPILFSLTGIQ